MNEVDFVELRFVWEEQVAIRPSPQLLRGAIGSCFPDNPLVHQHDGNRLVYRYPQIQYRWDFSGPIVVGLGAGAQFLLETHWIGRNLQLGCDQVTIREANVQFHRHTIQPATRLLRYHFAAPWLPFSQESYVRYKSLPIAQRSQELDRLAVAGTLMGLRGFGVHFSEQLFASFVFKSMKSCRYKGILFAGFYGDLLANVDLPQGFALGRAISHGFGWIIPTHREPKDESVGLD